MWVGGEGGRLLMGLLGLGRGKVNNVPGFGNAVLGNELAGMIERLCVRVVVGDAVETLVKVADQIAGLGGQRIARLAIVLALFNDALGLLRCPLSPTLWRFVNGC